MSKYILIVPSAAQEGQADQYNSWYDTQHLKDVCAVPGFVAGKRYDAVASSPDAAPAPFLAIYEIEADDPATALAELNRRAASGEMAISPALDVSSARMWLYKAR